VGGFRPGELATPQVYPRAPDGVWAWYAWRREQACATRPNRARKLLAELEHAKAHFLLVTQNVDGLPSGCPRRPPSRRPLHFAPRRWPSRWSPAGWWSPRPPWPTLPGGGEPRADAPDAVGAPFPAGGCLPGAWTAGAGRAAGPWARL